MFPRAGRAALKDFLRAEPKGNPEEQPCQSKENPIFPHSFTQIYIILLIGFCIGPPKMHRWFRIGPSKIHRLFCIGPPKNHRWFPIGPPQIHKRLGIGPPQVSLNLLPPEFNRQGILFTIGIMKEKQQKNILKYNYVYSYTSKRLQLYVIPCKTFLIHVGQRKCKVWL